MVGYRVEKDSIGEVKVADDVLWGAQTQRSLNNFQIGTEKMPLQVIDSLVQIKKACAIVNVKEGKLSQTIGESIVSICEEIIAGEFEEEFPLSVWQTGSGTQTNMNVNEVIAHMCNQEFSDVEVHPNDHVNMSQSSNDVFPTAMHVAAYHQIFSTLVPEMQRWIEVLETKEQENQQVIKIGRTHLQDATPLTFGQEISGWKEMLIRSLQAIKESAEKLLHLAIGGTAVGTGINASGDFGKSVCQELNKVTGYDFISDRNKFFALTSHQAISYSHGALRSLAGDLMKIANDIRWLASGPRCGIGEIIIPSNEPGSSIMPGKVNPTQAEALTMIVAQIMGNDTTIQFASSQGNFELNVYKPVIIMNYLQSVILLAEGMASFRENCLKGLVPNEDKMKQLLNDSLMLVTALSPHIGYQKSAEIAKEALKTNMTLKESAKKLGYATDEELDDWLNPEKML